MLLKRWRINGRLRSSSFGRPKEVLGMSYFARKLRYVAGEDEAGFSYHALVQIAKKKDGRLSRFVLYHRVMSFGHPERNLTLLLECSQVKTVEEAIKFWPFGGKRLGKILPKENQFSSPWQKTTLFLNHVGSGGAFENFGFEYAMQGIRYGRWARIGTPALWSKRRKKKPLQFGNISHILLVEQARLHELNEKERELEHELSSLESGRDYEREGSILLDENREQRYFVLWQKKKLKEKIHEANESIVRIKNEMRYIRSQNYSKFNGTESKEIAHTSEMK